VIQPCRRSTRRRRYGIPEPFDHEDFIFEPKMDGFRALAHVDGGRCTLVSRNGHIFKSWPQLGEEIPRSVRGNSAILDGEIVCLDSAGRPDFKSLLFRREWPVFYAFDLLQVEGEDICHLPLWQPSGGFAGSCRRIASRLLKVEHVAARGVDLFRAACEHDLERVVAKWRHGRYASDTNSTSWLKIKNPAYSQMEGRAELIHRGASHRQRSPVVRPELALR